MIPLKRRIALRLMTAAVLWPALVAAAEVFPSRPIRLIVGYPPGGQSDLIARLVAKSLGEQIGSPIVVDNRPGANGAIGVQSAIRSEPDGHTLLLGGGGNLMLAPLIDTSVSYDALRDVVPIARVARVPLILVARPDLPVNSGAELIEYGRRHPGRLSYASTAASSQLAGEQLQAVAGLDLLIVPYKGTGPALVDVMAGRVDFTLADVPSAAIHVRSGVLKVLASGGAERARKFPAVPTMAEQGVKEFAWESWQGIFVPSATPAPIVVRLRRHLADAIVSADFREALDRLGVEPIDEGAETLPEVLRRELASYKSLLVNSNLRVR